ncbi:hypothetical protein PG987_006740 [Apiospora arundinis]
MPPIVAAINHTATVSPSPPPRMFTTPALVTIVAASTAIFSLVKHIVPSRSSSSATITHVHELEGL